MALFNIRELSIDKLEAEAARPAFDSALSQPTQVSAAISIIQRIQPDILIVQEIDQLPGAADDPAHLLARLIASGPGGVHYPFVFAAPSNTGLLSGLDLDGDGYVASVSDLGSRRYGNDSFGFGTYPGQYSMAVLSRFPIDTAASRTFQQFRWQELPGHHMTDALSTAQGRPELRLSSKSHWDVVVRLSDLKDRERAATGRAAPSQAPPKAANEQEERSEPATAVLHLLVSHPTPPSFDGPEDLNGRRNFDEIRFWALYLDGHDGLTDDRGRRGGLDRREQFLIVGDLNAAPEQSESLYDGRTAISQLLEHTRVRDTGDTLVSTGAARTAEGAVETGTPSAPNRSSATADFRGGVRVDYLLPSRELPVEGGGVFWPLEPRDPLGASRARIASDHRMIWLDLAIPVPPIP